MGDTLKSVLIYIMILSKTHTPFSLRIKARRGKSSLSTSLYTAEVVMGKRNDMMKEAS